MKVPMIPIKKFRLAFLYFAVILSFIMCFVFFLTGCGSSKTKISILFHKSEVDGPFHELIKLYNDTHPDVKVEGQTSGGGGDYESVAQTKLGSNSVHIINYEGFGNMKKFENKLLDCSDLDIVKTLQGKNPDILDACTNESGKILGFPVAIEGFGYLVNKAPFNSAGVDISNVKNFNEFEVSCKQLKAAIDEGKLKEKFPNLNTVFAVWGRDPWSLTNHVFHYIVGKDFKNSADAYNSATFPFSAADDYRKIIDFQTVMSVEGEPTREKLSNLNTVDYTNAFDGKILNCKSCVGQLGTWVVPSIEKYDKDNKTNLLNDFELLPWFVPNEEKAKYMILSGQCFGINKDASEAQIKVCKDFLNWMYTDKQAKEIVYNKMKMVSPLISKEDLSKMKFDKITKKIVDAYVSGDFYKGGSIGLVRTEDWTLQNNGTAIQERLAGKIDDATFDKKIKDGWNDIFNAQKQKQ